MPILSTVGALATFKSTNFGVNFPYYAEFQQEIPITNFLEISPYYITFRQLTSANVLVKQQPITLVSAKDATDPAEINSFWGNIS